MSRPLLDMPGDEAAAPSPAGRAFPLLAAAARLDAPLAWCDGVAVSGREFLADAVALAGRLHDGGAVVNLCVDRYRFAVGFAAALLRGRTSLLPPNALPATLARLAGGDGALCGLIDDGLPPPAATGLRLLAVPARSSGPAPAALSGVPSIAASQPAACLLTSGSTGAPQPHGKTWGMLVANIRAEAERLAETLGADSLDGLAIVATVPAQHSYGFESSVLLGLLGGAAFYAGRPFYPADIADALARLPRPRALVTTPFHLKALLGAGLALPAADLVVCATAPLSPQLAARAEQAFGGAPLLEIYGCTEAGQVATRRTAHSDLWTTFGALRLAAMPADAGAGRYTVAGGHVAEPTPLADVLEAVDARRFRLLGRAGDIVNIAGRRSSLAHLDHHLNSIAGVDDGAFWMPAEVPDGVARPVAFVVAPTLDAQRLRAALRERLEDAFVPRRIVFVDALPRAATGKLGAEAFDALACAHLGSGVGA